MRRVYNTDEVVFYLRNNELISAYELRVKCDLPKSTAQDIIKRCLKNGWIAFECFIKPKRAHNKISIYRVTERDKIMRNLFLEIADEFMAELKEQKLLLSQVTSPNTGTGTSPNTGTGTSPNEDNISSASCNNLKRVPVISSPCGELEPVNLKEQKVSETQLSDSTELKKFPEDSGALLTGETELRDTIDLKVRQNEAREELARLNWKGRNGRVITEQEMERAFQLAKLLKE